MNKYISFVILTLAQVFTFLIVYEAAWSLGLMLLPETRRDLFWGGTVRFAVLVFAVVSIIGSLLSQVLWRRHLLIVQALSIVAFSLSFVGLMEYRPYRMLLLLGGGVVGFLVPALLLRGVLKKKAASNIAMQPTAK
jgi:hypothetical protein